MFRVLDTRTGELAIALDYYTPDQLEKAFRRPAKDGHLLCPICRSPVALKRDFDEMPHFLHNKGSDCPHANDDLELLKLRAALYRFLRREFGPDVTAEHDLPDSKVPRSVDCWVESKGKKFAYWIFDKEVKSSAKRTLIRDAIGKEGATPLFLFAEPMLKRARENALILGDTEKFAKVCTKFDVLDGKHEGGSIHYLGLRGPDAMLTTFRTLRDESNSGVFEGTERKKLLAEAEVCFDSGELVHPGEKTHAEIVRARKAREEFERESRPTHAEAIRRREWEEATRRLPRTNESFAQIMKRLLRPREDIQSIELRQDREGPCEFCGIVTRDWTVFNGKTGMCKCRKCYERVAAENWRQRHGEWKPDSESDGKVA